MWAPFVIPTESFQLFPRGQGLTTSVLEPERQDPLDRQKGSESGRAIKGSVIDEKSALNEEYFEPSRAI